MLEFTFRKVQKFGSELFYPESHLSLTVCRLMGKKSMSKRDIMTLKDSGYIVSIFQ
jgi:hypothetical protein